MGIQLFLAQPENFGKVNFNNDRLEIRKLQLKSIIDLALHNRKLAGRAICIYTIQLFFHFYNNIPESGTLVRTYTD